MSRTRSTKVLPSYGAAGGGLRARCPLLTPDGDADGDGLLTPDGDADGDGAADDTLPPPPPAPLAAAGAKSTCAACDIAPSAA